MKLNNNISLQLLKKGWKFFKKSEYLAYEVLLLNFNQYLIEIYDFNNLIKYNLMINSKGMYEFFKFDLKSTEHDEILEEIKKINNDFE